jgi:hypothetical protein
MHGSASRFGQSKPVPLHNRGGFRTGCGGSRDLNGWNLGFGEHVDRTRSFGGALTIRPSALRSTA